jgi:hypothetical protein
MLPASMNETLEFLHTKIFEIVGIYLISIFYVRDSLVSLSVNLDLRKGLRTKPGVLYSMR